MAYRDPNGQVEPAPAVADVVEAVYLPGGPWTQSSWFSELDWQTRLKRFVDPQQSRRHLVLRARRGERRRGLFRRLRSLEQPADRVHRRIRLSLGSSDDRASEWIPVRSALMLNIPYWGPAPFMITQVGRRDTAPLELVDSAERGLCPIRQSPATGRSAHANRAHGL